MGKMPHEVYNLDFPPASAVQLPLPWVRLTLGYIILDFLSYCMIDGTLLVAASCVVLAALVYLMWRSATAEEWTSLTQTEKKKWRLDEEKRKEAKK